MLTSSSIDFGKKNDASMSMGTSGDNGALNRNTMSQNLNNNKSKDERKI